MIGPRAHLRDVADGAVLVGYPEASEQASNRAAAALGRRLRRLSRRGILDAIPAARTLLVLFEPSILSRGRLEREASRGMAQEREAESRLFRIPVAYGGEAGADLKDIARRVGMTPEAFASRHASAEYRVAFIGFAPGFPYLAGLPPQLASARMPSPRPRVEAGSVAIGGTWTGVYPSATPGGWRLIGRTTAVLFDPEDEPPALLSAGDRVRFDPVAEGDLPAPPSRNPEESRRRPILRVGRPGVFASVQAAPRHGHGASGVPPGGAMDARALAAANRLVGNPDDAPGLEVALGGTELELCEDAIGALSGGDLSAQWNGKPAPLFEMFRLRSGDHLAFGRARLGARAYLAISGGLAFGGAFGSTRRLEAGDELAAGSPHAAVSPTASSLPPNSASEPSLRVILGPQAEYFPQEVIGRFLASPWHVSPESDRRGLRLEGEPLAHTREPEIPPEGTAPGSIQVPGSGLPILLGPDRPVTGGYPKIATVIGADLPLLGQAAPGGVLRFRAVTLEEALDARRGSGSTISLP